MKSNELKQLRADKLKEMSSLIELKETEKREFNETESTKFDALDEEIRSFDTKIANAEKEEAHKVRMAGSAPAIKTDSKNEKYSLVEHINQVRSGKGTNGLYNEVQKEGEKELRDLGVYNASEFSVSIPSNYTRDLSVGSATKGAEMVQTDKQGFLFELMEDSLISKLGVSTINGLVNNIDMNKQNNSMNAVWANETDEVSTIDFQVGSVPLRPTRLVAPYAISNKLLVQSSIAESVVREELQRKIRKGLDMKFVELLLAQAGTIAVTGGANGSAITYGKILEMIQKVGEASEDIGLAKFLINFKTWADLKQLKKDAGSGRMVLDSDNTIDGFRYEASNYVNRDLTKGTGTGLSALAFGDFSKVYLGNFGALDLVVDPYTLATSAKTKITSNSFHGFAFTYPEAIAVVKDAV